MATPSRKRGGMFDRFNVDARVYDEILGNRLKV